ncbi:hypothetical protein M885DRAFT_506604, partial [Pelagophyceae sp. CCMP2097]
LTKTRPSASSLTGYEARLRCGLLRRSGAKSLLPPPSDGRASPVESSYLAPHISHPCSTTPSAAASILLLRSGNSHRPQSTDDAMTPPSGARTRRYGLPVILLPKACAVVETGSPPSISTQPWSLVRPAAEDFFGADFLGVPKPAPSATARRGATCAGAHAAASERHANARYFDTMTAGRESWSRARPTRASRCS